MNDVGFWSTFLSFVIGHSLLFTPECQLFKAGCPSHRPPTSPSFPITLWRTILFLCSMCQNLQESQTYATVGSRNRRLEFGIEFRAAGMSNPASSTRQGDTCPRDRVSSLAVKYVIATLASLCFDYHMNLWPSISIVDGKSEVG